MRDARDARLFFGATSVVVTFGLLLSSSSPSPKTAGSFASTPARILNFFSFFTVQSNILVADLLLHTLSPILCLFGWLLFGVRRKLDSRIVRLAVIAPVRCAMVAALFLGLAFAALGISRRLPAAELAPSSS